MAYADQEMSGSRIAAIIIVALIHIALGYTLITGLAYKGFAAVVERVTTVDIEEEVPEEEEPPPPEEEVTAPPPPVAPPPPISIAPSPPPIRTQENIPPPAPPPRIVPPPAPPAAAPPPPPPPPPPSQARAAARDNFSRWQRQIVGEGYPSAAVRREIEGTVGLAVTIGANGRVASCRVTGSSGESILDEGACRAMERYARYDPALDAAGNPTTGSDSLSIVYRLE